MSRRATKILLIVLSSIVGFVVVATLGLIWLVGGFRPNPAQADAAPIVTAVTRVNGGIACDVGDAGYSPDNTVPWYQGMLDAPDSPTLQSRLAAAAASNGYQLEANPHDPAHSSVYLVGHNGRRDMEVRIFRGEKAVFAYCNSGEKKRLAPGAALIEVDIAYPDRVDRG
ncbi:MAG TPA: hypothetical protein VGM94_09905 [Galbitalea sp.]|jgi:hypothetical protein